MDATAPFGRLPENEKMRRTRNYDLYEGDGETIGEARGLPGKQPLGRDQELREKDETIRRTEQRFRYFQRNAEEDDGLGAPDSVFDNFDRFDAFPERKERNRPRRKNTRHKAAWAFCILLSML